MGSSISTIAFLTNPELYPDAKPHYRSTGLPDGYAAEMEAAFPFEHPTDDELERMYAESQCILAEQELEQARIETATAEQAVAPQAAIMNSPAQQPRPRFAVCPCVSPQGKKYVATVEVQGRRRPIRCGSFRAERQAWEAAQKMAEAIRAKNAVA